MIEDFIKVLWIEDDPAVTQAFPLEAENYDIDLRAFPCWDDAKIALEKDFDTWDAIILDAKCKQHRDSADNAPKFLMEVFSNINRIFAQKNHTIHWYVLSGGAESEINDLIPDDREKWDGDGWNKKYYSKDTDRSILFKRIRNHKFIRSREIQVKTELFRDVFEAIRERELDEDIELSMLKLLVPLRFPEDISVVDYNQRYSEVRICLEHIFRAMIRDGLLPDSLGKDKNGKDSPNLSWSSKFINGQPDTKSYIVVNNNIFPGIMADNIKDMVFAVGQDVHSSASKDGVDFKIYLYNNGTSYQIQSFALSLCDIIIWYNNYMREHKDIEANKKNWTYASQIQSQL